MDSFWLLLHMVGKALSQYVLRADLLFVVGVVFLLVYGQYQRVAGLEKRLYGAVKNSPDRATLSAALYGVAGGLVTTALFLLIGVPLNETGIWYIWAVAILLALFHPRFLCFSYGGGLISLSYLLFGAPRVDVAALMALVAVLHLVEALLIWTTGYRHATPVYVRMRNGQAVGGFALQKFWPLPFVALIAFAGLSAGGVPGGDPGHIDMPSWWPLLKPAGDPAGPLSMALFPVVAALGYGDLALTAAPREKARRTALLLLAFSLILLALALLARRGTAWAFAAALFSPVAHDWVIHLGRRSEEVGRPLFSADGGVMVLDVFPRTPAAAMGMRSGDVILSLNGEPVRERSDVQRALEPWALVVDAEVKNVVEGTGVRRLHYAGRVPPLGVVLVPEAGETAVLDVHRPARVPAMWRWLRKRLAHWAGS